MFGKIVPSSADRRHFGSLALRSVAVTFSVAALALWLGLPGASAGPSKANARWGEKDWICPGISLSTTLPIPPEGMASTRTVTLDKNCTSVWGPIQFVPVDQLSSYFAQEGAQGYLTTLTDQIKEMPQTTDAATSTSWTLHADQAIWDCCGIRMNHLYTDASWTGNGAIILGYSVGGGYHYATENSPPSCGNGWYPVNPYQVQTGGGVGQSTASFRQHVEFGYKGVFDCSGNTYYNILDNYETLYGDGRATCTFERWSRTWLGSWSWVTSCTR